MASSLSLASACLSANLTSSFLLLTSQLCKVFLWLLARNALEGRGKVFRVTEANMVGDIADPQVWILLG